VITRVAQVPSSGLAGLGLGTAVGDAVAAGGLEGIALGETVPPLQAVTTRATRMAAIRIDFI
jgi:hypothetical protein